MEIHQVQPAELRQARYDMHGLGVTFCKEGELDVSAEKMADRQLEAIANGLGATFFLIDEGEKVGMLCLKVCDMDAWEEPVAHETAIFILSACRKAGDGFKMLMEAAESWCKNAKIKRFIVSNIYGGNLRPEIVGKAYERMGFNILQSDYIKEVADDS